jgi:methylenetetrahydrofolate--tRNA-(uracil-5-)-methyltransferase
MTGRLLAADILGQTLNPPPRETALGCLWQHVQGVNRLDHSSHEPQNINWAMFTPPPEGTKKHEKKRIRVLRAEKELDLWAETNSIAIATSNIVPEELVKKKKPKRAMPLPPVPEAS